MSPFFTGSVTVTAYTGSNATYLALWTDVDAADDDDDDVSSYFSTSSDAGLSWK